MAHFAELDENNVVKRVIVISNYDLLDEDGVEQEQLGIDTCTKLLGGGPWVQTSYNGNFRRICAPVGGTYDPINDVFICPQPYASWELDANFDWQPPVPYPDDGNDWIWDEENLSWVRVNPE